MLCCWKSHFISCSSLRGYAGSQPWYSEILHIYSVWSWNFLGATFLVVAAGGASGRGAGTSVLVVRVLLVVFFWWWLCSGFWWWGCCGQWLFLLFSVFLFSCSSPSSVLVSDADPNIPKAYYSISCIILKYFEHDMLRLTRSWLISLGYSVICCFHWLLESFSQDGLHCNDKPVRRSNDRHGGRDEMDKTRKYPQPFAFVIRRNDRKHIDNQGWFQGPPIMGPPYDSKLPKLFP